MSRKSPVSPEKEKRTPSSDKGAEEWAVKAIFPGEHDYRYFQTLEEFQAYCDAPTPKPIEKLDVPKIGSPVVDIFNKINEIIDRLNKL